MKYGSLLLVLGLLFGAAGAGAQGSDAKTGSQSQKGPEPTPYQDWQVLCAKDDKGKEHCQMGQPIASLTIGKDKAGKDVNFPILATFRYIPGDKTPILSVNLPLGVPLAPGVGLQIDGGKPIRLPYQMCSPNVGCIAAIQAKNKLVTALKKGNKAVFAIALEKKVGKIPVSLLGFTKAFNHIKRSK
jgi:invasion protein IalB